MITRRGFLGLAAAIPIATMLPWDPANAAGLTPDVVALSPHPDDETLAMGALLACLASLGLSVHVVPVTAGEASGVRAELGWDVPTFQAARLAEQQHACTALGAVQDGCLYAPDGGVTDAIAQQAVAQVRAQYPGALIVTTSPDDTHPDHAALGRAAATDALSVLCMSMAFRVWPRNVNTLTDPTGRLIVAARAYTTGAAIGARSVPSQWANLTKHPASHYHH